LPLGFKQFLQILKKQVVKKRSNVGLGYYSDSRTRNTMFNLKVIHPSCVYNATSNADIHSLDTTSYYRQSQLHVSAADGSHQKNIKTL
jgi:hypothetical protein